MTNEKPVSMVEVTESGTDAERLSNLARVLAQRIDTCEDDRLLPQLARQYRETVRVLAEIGSYSDEDEVEAIRKA